MPLFFERFDIASSNDDYEEGMAIPDKVIRAPGNRPTQLQEEALKLVALFAQARSTKFGEPEYFRRGYLSHPYATRQGFS